VVVKLGAFQPGDLAVYIPIDSVVDTARPEFSFLAEHGATHRVKAKRLRGVFSMGMLVPANGVLYAGNEQPDIATLLGISKYEPPVNTKGTHGAGEVCARPGVDESLPDPG